MITNKKLINTAFQSTYIQQNINTNNLIFNNQINQNTGQVSANLNEISFETFRNADFSIATTFISPKYRAGIVINHIDKIFIKSIEQLYPKVKIHFSKSFYNKNNNTFLNSVITPEIIFNFQNNFNQITYGFHLVNNIFLTRFFIKHNMKFNTISSTITIGTYIRNIRLSYSYNTFLTSKITIPTSSNQISLQYSFNCIKKRNSKNTIYCLKI